MPTIYGMPPHDGKMVDVRSSLGSLGSIDHVVIPQKSTTLEIRVIVFALSSRKCIVGADNSEVSIG
jgi:hypothetical protein